MLYGMWDYHSTMSPISIPYMVKSVGKDLEKSGHTIQRVTFGSRRWAEYTSLHDCPYNIVYDSEVERGLILFFENNLLKCRLKISNLPAEERVPD